MTIERFEDLKSWQEAGKLVQIVYRLTKKEEFRQDRAVGWQVQAAAESSLLRGSVELSNRRTAEQRIHLYVALDQGYIEQDEFDEAYKQAELVATLVSGSIKNLDYQIAARSSVNRDRRRNAR